MNVQLDNLDCKRIAIFKSTLELIKDHGFHGTPISQIAKNANVATGTIYHYFDSKDSLITDLYIIVKNKLAKAILQNDDEQLSYRERFIHYWINECRFFIQNETILVFLEQYINSHY